MMDYCFVFKLLVLKPTILDKDGGHVYMYP